LKNVNASDTEWYMVNEWCPRTRCQNTALGSRAVVNH